MAFDVVDDGHEDAAAQAFEALRAEVAGLRVSLDDLAARGEAAPDYAPTLGAMAGSLKAIEAHPALRQTPAAFVSEIAYASHNMQQRVSHELFVANQTVGSAAHVLERLIGGHRSAKEHNYRLAVMAAAGVVFGIVFWVSLSGPIARALPASWLVPERMAAASLRLDRYDAGLRLIQSDPRQIVAPPPSRGKHTR